MKAQLNIEFIAGSILFLIAMTFVVTQALGVIPQFENQVAANNRQVEADTLTRFLLKQPGYWSNGTHNGTDWETSTHTNKTKILGLAAEPYRVDRDKVKDLVDNRSHFTVNYSESLDILAVDTRTPGDAVKHDVEYRLENITEYVVVETFSTYNKSEEADDVPEKITEPSEQEYDDIEDDTVHYGQEEINDVQVQVLAANASTGEDGEIYVKKHDWNFSDVDGHDNSVTKTYTFNGENYTLQGNDMGVEQSRGTTVVFTRGLLHNPPYGNSPGLTAAQVVREERYATTTRGTLVKLSAEVWRDE